MNEQLRLILRAIVNEHGLTTAAAVNAAMFVAAKRWQPEDTTMFGTDAQARLLELVGEQKYE